MPERISEQSRETKETEIKVKLNIDGTGKYDIRIPCDKVPSIDNRLKLFSHCMEQLAKHGLFDLDIEAKSLDLDDHHLYEDISITLGQAFDKALGERKGVARVGEMSWPFEGVQAHANIDLSGRGYFHLGIQYENPAFYSGQYTGPRFNDNYREMLLEWGDSFAKNAKINYVSRITVLDPLRLDNHHGAEAFFKASARALRYAASTDPRAIGQIPSTKGTLIQ